MHYVGLYELISERAAADEIPWKVAADLILEEMWEEEEAKKAVKKGVYQDDDLPND